MFFFAPRSAEAGVRVGVQMPPLCPVSVSRQAWAGCPGPGRGGESRGAARGDLRSCFLATHKDPRHVLFAPSLSHFDDNADNTPPRRRPGPRPDPRGQPALGEMCVWGVCVPVALPDTGKGKNEPRVPGDVLLSPDPPSPHFLRTGRGERRPLHARSVPSFQQRSHTTARHRHHKTQLVSPSPHTPHPPPHKHTQIGKKHPPCFFSSPPQAPAPRPRAWPASP